MLLRSVKSITITAIAACTVLLPLTSASASAATRTWYGPYETQGLCEYWRSAMAAVDSGTSPQCYDQYNPKKWKFYVES